MSFILSKLSKKRTKKNMFNAPVFGDLQIIRKQPFSIIQNHNNVQVTLFEELIKVILETSLLLKICNVKGKPP